MTYGKDKLKHTEFKNVKHPTAAAMEIVEAYNDNGQKTDPLGMYTGRPLEADENYRAVAIPRYDTEAVRYCNGKRYMKPERVGEYGADDNYRNVKDQAENTGIPDATSGMHYVMEGIVPTQDADDLS